VCLASYCRNSAIEIQLAIASSRRSLHSTKKDCGIYHQENILIHYSPICKVTNVERHHVIWETHGVLHNMSQLFTECVLLNDQTAKSFATDHCSTGLLHYCWWPLLIYASSKVTFNEALLFFCKHFFVAEFAGLVSALLWPLAPSSVKPADNSFKAPALKAGPFLVFSMWRHTLSISGGTHSVLSLKVACTFDVANGALERSQLQPCFDGISFISVLWKCSQSSLGLECTQLLQSHTLCCVGAAG